MLHRNFWQNYFVLSECLHCTSCSSFQERTLRTRILLEPIVQAQSLCNHFGSLSIPAEAPSGSAKSDIALRDFQTQPTIANTRKEEAEEKKRRKRRRRASSQVFHDATPRHLEMVGMTLIPSSPNMVVNLAAFHMYTCLIQSEELYPVWGAWMASHARRGELWQDCVCCGCWVGRFTVSSHTTPQSPSVDCLRQQNSRTRS